MDGGKGVDDDAGSFSSSSTATATSSTSSPQKNELTQGTYDRFFCCPTLHSTISTRLHYAVALALLLARIVRLIRRPSNKLTTLAAVLLLMNTIVATPCSSKK